MNRLKLWLFVVLLLGAGAGNLYFLTGWLTARSIAHIDRELRSSAAVADARIRWLGASVSAMADAAARSPSVAGAFADVGASPLAPAEDAVAAAGGALNSDMTAGLVAVASPKQGVSARTGGASGKTVAAPEALLVEAKAGRRSQAWIRLDGTLWMVATVPAGPGGAIAVGLPLDAAYAQALRGVTGVDVTSVVDGKVAATTLAPADASAVSATDASNARRPVDVGRLGRIKAALGWPAPAMPILFANPPAARALTLPIEGAGAAALVLSVSTAPFFSGLAAYQLLALVAMALFLLVGVLLGLFMSEESEPSLPRELVAAADRITRGDFSARAPSLAGSAGTIGAALNRAAEAAQHPTRIEPVGAAIPHGALATEARPEPEPAAVAPAPEHTAEAAALEPAPELTGTADAAATPEPAFQSAPGSYEPSNGSAAEPAVTQPLFAPLGHDAPAAESTPEAFGGLETVPEAREEAPAPDEDEPHWRSVYDDFVRLRGVTGEPAEGITYERFRSRLERNREQLKDKHGARTVRFQPYVKDGKVALRATPVR